MSKLLDLTGHVFTRLTVIERAPNIGRRIAWLCQCTCGNILAIASHTLRSGKTRSCGCLVKETCGNSFRTHGKSRSAEHIAWKNMKKRCYQPAYESFHRYGGRGITVCAAWRNSFAQFFADMGPRPTPQHSLDRINNDGPYSKKNCRWSTKTDQMNNMNSNHIFTFRGKTQTVSQWARELHVNPETLRCRLVDSHWPIERALMTPIRLRTRAIPIRTS